MKKTKPNLLDKPPVFIKENMTVGEKAGRLDEDIGKTNESFIAIVQCVKKAF